MDNKKKVILIAIIILIILMIIISIIMIFNKKKSTMNQYMYVEEIENKNIQKVDNYSQFFSVSNCITLYYTYIGQKDEGVYQLLDTEYVQENNITNTNVLDKIEKVSSENIYYNAEEMYTQDNKKLKIYYVHGKLKEDMFEEKSVDTYFIVYVDNYNTTFAIYPITQSEYNTCIQNGKEIHIEEIAKNDKNKYTSIIVNDETITTRLLYDYKDKVQNDIEASYEKLNLRI